MKKDTLPKSWAMSVITLISIGLWATIWAILIR